MALQPTGPRVPREQGQGAVRRAGVQLPVGRPSAPPAAVPAPLPEPIRARPAPGFRLKTAVTDEEIDAQIRRLMTLIANDNIDPDAPVGSYLNMLV